MAALMIQGASSSSGKSLITTALARALVRRGIDVAPFKAQNMSNNARVVAHGEIGAAQYLQALAARLEPDVRMNPVLVKPESEHRSQVIVLGRVDAEASRLPWRARAPRLWPSIVRALEALLVEHELVLIEGAGSPAEINLRDADLANMRTAEAAGARVALVADIDRGGAFAHLYGTWALLAAGERARVCGFLLNRFRGEASLLEPAPAMLAQLTGVPTVGVLPWLDHRLPDEDGAAPPSPAGDRPTVAVLRYPTASNLDEFKLLEQVVRVRWAAAPADVEGAQLVVLPGSKHVAADLGWMARTGLADAVRARAVTGGPVLGICGGLQMLGERVADHTGRDGSAAGLGLLPLETALLEPKRTERTTTRFGVLGEPWSALTGRPLAGYQIRHGRTTATAAVAEALPGGLGFVDGPVLGIYVHSAFEQPELLAALFGSEPRRTLDEAFDELADAVEEHVDVDLLLREAGIGS